MALSVIPVLIGTALVLGGGAASAQIMALADGELNEQFEERSTEITGALLVGVQRSPPAVPSEFGLSAVVPEAWEDRTTCLRVVSASGRYEVVENYLIRPDDPADSAAAPANVVTIEYPTALAEWLLAQGRNGIAALLSGDPCSTDVSAMPREVAITHWGDATDGPVDFLFNALGADRVLLYVGESREAIQCMPVLGEILTAYDTVCTVPADRLQSEEVEVRLVRVENRQPARPMDFKVTLPGN